MSILDRQIPFLAPDKVHHIGSATLWEHLLRGIDFTEKHMGEHGLPLILFSDWNDHLGPFGRRGKGESIMVSQQLIYALRQMIELAELRGEQKLVEKFKARIQQQEKPLQSTPGMVTGTWGLMMTAIPQALTPLSICDLAEFPELDGDLGAVRKNSTSMPWTAQKRSWTPALVSY